MFSVFHQIAKVQRSETTSKNTAILHLTFFFFLEMIFIHFQITSCGGSTLFKGVHMVNVILINDLEIFWIFHILLLIFLTIIFLCIHFFRNFSSTVFFTNNYSKLHFQCSQTFQTFLKPVQTSLAKTKKKKKCCSPKTGSDILWYIYKIFICV